jgi:ubiquinone/menaquinone biosynthesis C-methylase UbiE
MEVEDNVADFVMSRGSLWFWDDQPQGLREIQRILKPGGVAVVGGGLGRYMPDTMRKRILGKIRKRLKKDNQTRPTLKELSVPAAEAGLSNFRVFDDGEGKGGRWIEIKKQYLRREIS